MSPVGITLLVVIILIKPIVLLVGAWRIRWILSFLEKRIPFLYELSMLIAALMSIKRNRILLYITSIILGIILLASFYHDRSRWDWLVFGLLMNGTGMFLLWKEYTKK